MVDIVVPRSGTLVESEVLPAVLADTEGGSSWHVRGRSSCVEVGFRLAGVAGAESPHILLRSYRHD